MSDLKEWLHDNGMILTICNGAVTICDGNCEDCDGSEEDDDG